MRKIKQYSLVKFDYNQIPKEYQYHYRSIFKDERLGKFIFFGEIPNMLGHCIVSGYDTGKIYSGFHIENFIELTDEEL